jgi:hypothetical protein
MKAFALFSVALAVLCVVSAQKVTITQYDTPNCTGPIPLSRGPGNPIVFDVGVCIVPKDDRQDPGQPPRPAESFKFVCDGKTATQTGYLPDTGKNTSSCLIVDPTKFVAVQLNTCIIIQGHNDPMKNKNNTSAMWTCTMPGATISTSGSGSSINSGFLPFSFFLTSVVAALVAL